MNSDDLKGALAPVVKQHCARQGVYVLHAFHKKAKKGIATPKEELDLASKRYKELVRSLRRS